MLFLMYIIWYILIAVFIFCMLKTYLCKHFYCGVKNDRFYIMFCRYAYIFDVRCVEYIYNDFILLSASFDVIVANVRSCFRSRKIGGCGCITHLQLN